MHVLTNNLELKLALKDNVELGRVFKFSPVLLDVPSHKPQVPEKKLTANTNYLASG
jgi:hypothetical protein